MFSIVYFIFSMLCILGIILSNIYDVLKQIRDRLPEPLKDQDDRRRNP